jgi:hypothetical protein
MKKGELALTLRLLFGCSISKARLRATEGTRKTALPELSGGLRSGGRLPSEFDQTQSNLL